MKRFLVAMVMLLSVPMAAGAATLYDTQTADNMSIITQSFDGFDTWVNVRIADNNTIPYASHDGNAIVNQWDMFFDSYVYADTAEVSTGFIGLNLTIENASNHNWSDFHLEFYDLYYTGLITVPILVADNDFFDQTNFVEPGATTDSYSAIHFWSDGVELAPGETLEVFVLIDLNEMPELASGFSIRQIATTSVPVPSAGLLFFAGLSGLMFWRRKCS